ncbi:rhodanese domain-containing protein [Xylariaceae sp. FL0016]|nr:rhodanese domain-containing protein [Xylariaceae sp. FL0016]
MAARLTLRGAARAFSDSTAPASRATVVFPSTSSRAPIRSYAVTRSRSPAPVRSLGVFEIGSRGPPLRYGGVRWSSESATGSKIWTFQEIDALSKSEPSSTPSAIIIDVREPSELASTGKIPGALHIPITSRPDAFHLPVDEFEDVFDFPRPEKDQELVFYCKAGVRSRAAAGIAREAGWKQVGEYPGSWVEWSGKGGKVER